MIWQGFLKLGKGPPKLSIVWLLPHKISSQMRAQCLFKLKLHFRLTCAREAYGSPP
jgi:hypothetical protein